MKRHFILPLAILFFAISTNAQEGAAVSSGNYYKENAKPRYGIFLNGGFTFPYTDIKSPKSVNYIIGGEGQYRALHYLDLVLDLRLGRLKAGDYSTANSMGFTNLIFDASILGRFYPLKLMNNVPLNSPMYYVGGLYVGAGLGMVKSKVAAHIFNDKNFDYIGNYTGSDVILPLEIGATIPVAQLPKMQQVSININYRVNFALGDKMDGYVTPRSVNDQNDVYNTFTVGVGYNF